MKKNVLFALLLVAFIMPSRAQDTVQMTSECYLSNHVRPAVFQLGSNLLAYVMDGTSGVGYEKPLPDTTTVYGIALTAKRPDKDYEDSSGYTVYMYTVNDSNRMVLIDSATKYSRATQYMYEGTTDTFYAASVVPCYEYYFSQPHVITDTAIYLGVKWNYSFMPRFSIYFGADQCFCHSVVYLDSDTLRYAGSRTSYWWGGLFPIIERRSENCPEAVDVGYARLDSNTVMFQWDSNITYGDWQVCYGPQGFPPDTMQAIVTAVPHATLTGLSDTAHYDVYIRSRCESCPDDVISSWAGPFNFCLATLGIAAVQAPDVTLAPNPTTGKLTVGCEAEIKEVEMYDMQGRMISGKWKEESGKSVVLDLAGLPAGSYILVAHTTKGVATRTVEKR